MKKTLLIGVNVIALLVLVQVTLGQVTMPAAITIEPATADGWTEITLTVDPAQACVPEGKASVAGVSIVKMHSAAVLFDQKEDFEAKSVWGAVGVDYDAEPKDGVHTGPDLEPNGDGTYSITFTPGDFYGVEEGSTIIGITAVFNGGSWDNECKDNGDDGCIDFFIPLSYVDPTPALKFKLDLTYQEELGNFNSDGGKAYVILDGTDHEMDQLLEGLFAVAKYETTITEGLTEGTAFSYKFKMDDTEETVEARTDTVTGSQLVLSHMFNNVEWPVPYGSIKFECDMRYYMREDLFDPATQFVDIAGSLNGWAPTEADKLSDDDADSVYSITVTDLTPGDKIEFKFRIDGSWDAGQHDQISNRIAIVRAGANTEDGDRRIVGILNNYVPGSVPVTLAVNMTRAEDAGFFDPAKDYIDVAGGFNGWPDGYSKTGSDLTDSDEDGIYITTVPLIAVAGDTMEYKFRINSSWAANMHDQIDNRKFGVKDTTGGVVNAADTVWFNNIPLFIDQESITRIGKVSIYPNPVEEVLYINNAVDMFEIRVINITGQVVRSVTADSRTFYELNTSDLAKGVYILSVYGKNGYTGTAKFIKR